MSREIEAQHDQVASQLDHDRRMRVFDRLNDITAQGSKNLAVLNGGAVVAMLAFVQALVEKPVYQTFKPYGVAALVYFLAGALLATLVFFFQHAYIHHSFQNHRHQMVWRKSVWWLLIVSAVSAFAGGVLVVLGIQVAL